MDIRTALATIGAGITSFLLVAVLGTELIALEFSAMIGLPLGLLAGVVVALWLWSRIDTFRPTIRQAVAAYGAFGATALALLGLRYVNVGRSVLTFEVVVGGSLAAAVIVYVALAVSDRDPPP